MKPNLQLCNGCQWLMTERIEGPAERSTGRYQCKSGIKSSNPYPFPVLLAIFFDRDVLYADSVPETCPYYLEQLVKNDEAKL